MDRSGFGLCQSAIRVRFGAGLSSPSKGERAEVWKLSEAKMLKLRITETTSLAVLFLRLGSEAKMLKRRITEQRRMFPAITLAVCCIHFCAQLSYGQSEKISPRADITTAPRIEKLIDEGRLSEAREKLRTRLAQEGEHPRLLLFEAMILYREQQYAQSLRKLERSLHLYDSDPDVYKLIGLNLVSVGREDLAGRYFEKATQLAPRDFMARYYLALYQITSKQFAQAEASSQAVIQLNPKYVDAYLALGVAQEQLGKETEALQTYQKAIEIAEQQSLKTEAPAMYLARLLISLQRYEQSLPPLQKVVAINPKSVEALTLLGRALSRLERYEEAIPSLQAAARLAPQDKAPHYLLMGIYQKLGNTSDAQREMQIFRALEANEKKQ
jgi:tetratricopeptide (TPR) repeat protein